MENHHTSSQTGEENPTREESRGALEIEQMLSAQSTSPFVKPLHYVGTEDEAGTGGELSGDTKS